MKIIQVPKANFNIRRIGNVTDPMHVRITVNAISRPSCDTLLEGGDMSTPTKFRVWCLKRGPFVFGGGKRDLDSLAAKLLVTERTCIYCGCEDGRACAGGCSWVIIFQHSHAGVCSNCIALHKPVAAVVKKKK